MSFLYKTLYYKGNPDAEYQFRTSGWYKRKKGSKEKWYPVEADKVDILFRYLKGRAFFNYSATAKIGTVLLLGVGVYFLNKKYDLFGRLKNIKS